MISGEQSQSSSFKVSAFAVLQIVRLETSATMAKEKKERIVRFIRVIAVLSIKLLVSEIGLLVTCLAWIGMPNAFMAVGDGVLLSWWEVE